MPAQETGETHQLLEVVGAEKYISLLIDSGADVIGCKNRSNGTQVRDFKAEVGTCSTGNAMFTEGMGDLAFELPSGRKVEATEVMRRT
jgi:hypothetical protein